MNNMPGFTAEVSLYKTSWRYVTGESKTSIFHGGGPGVEIFPALIAQAPFTGGLAGSAPQEVANRLALMMTVGWSALYVAN